MLNEPLLPDNSVVSGPVKPNYIDRYSQPKSMRMAKATAHLSFFDEEVTAQNNGAQVLGAPKEGVVRQVHPKNSLNDLDGSEWIQETKSFFFQKGLGSKHPHARIERQHPAPFSFQDVQRLILFFTKAGHTVLDPFGGVGSTAKACALTNRRAVSVELSERWHQLAIERLETEVAQGESAKHQLIQNDVRTALKEFDEDYFDFIVTSPPYWSILNKSPDHKAMERVREKLATNYSESDSDLGNIEDYESFLDAIVSVFLDCAMKLKPKKYMALVVSDFRHDNRFYSFHSDLIQRLDQRRLSTTQILGLQGVKTLLQNHKSLKPYGYPHAYVENVHHQYILIFRKQTKKA